MKNSIFVLRVPFTANLVEITEFFAVQLETHTAKWPKALDPPTLARFTAALRSHVRRSRKPLKSLHSLQELLKPVRRIHRSRGEGGFPNHPGARFAGISAEYAATKEGTFASTKAIPEKPKTSSQTRDSGRATAS